MKLALTFLALSSLISVAIPLAAHADEISHETALDVLNRALLLCPQPNNPYQNGLLALRGNVFENVHGWYDPRGDRYEIRAMAISSPRAYNRAIMAPDRVVGEVQIFFGYPPRPNADRPLACRVHVSPS